ARGPSWPRTVGSPVEPITSRPLVPFSAWKSTICSNTSKLTVSSSLNGVAMATQDPLGSYTWHRLRDLVALRSRPVRRQAVRLAASSGCRIPSAGGAHHVDAPRGLDDGGGGAYSPRRE